MAKQGLNKIILVIEAGFNLNRVASGACGPARRLEDSRQVRLFIPYCAISLGLNDDANRPVPALHFLYGGCVMLFESGSVVPADVFLDAFSAPKAVLTTPSLKELVERRVALAIKAHRFRSLQTSDVKDGAFHCEPGKQRAYDKRLTDLDAAIAERSGRSLYPCQR